MKKSFGATGALVCALFACVSPAMAADPPDAGGVLRDNRDTQPVPAPSAVPPANLPDAPVATPAEDEPAFTLRGVRFRGNEAISAAELETLVADQVGQPTGFAGLNRLAERLTAHYRAAGYPLALVLVPPQSINGGVVQFDVLEGRYGRVELRNGSDLRYGLLQNVLGDELASGKPIRQPALDNILLRANDLPGTATRATFSTGSERGSADLQVDAIGTGRVGGELRADNGGNPYAGAERLHASLYWNNPTGGGDRLTLAAVTAGAGLTTFSLGYQLPVWFSEHRFGVQANWLDYELGENFKALDSNGETRDGEAWWQWLAVRSRPWNLSTRLAWQQRDLESRLDALNVSEPKSTRVLRAGISVDNRDAGHDWIGRVSVTLSAGELNIEDAAALAGDQLTARTDGRFMKTNLSAVHVWRLSDRVRWLNELEAQQAVDNLDSSEKMSLGGPSAVRAYPVGEAAGDNAVLLRSNVLLPLPISEQRGAWEARLFADAGYSEMHHRLWVGFGGGNARHVAGAGAALHWKWQGLSTALTVAQRIGNEPAQSWKDDSTQFWAELGWQF